MSALYFDYAATTPLDPRVAAVMAAAQDSAVPVANPSSSHAPGRQAAAQIDQARRQVLDAVGLPDQELLWTSGATEADNLAILGTVMALDDRDSTRRRLLVAATEHSAVIAAATAAKRYGFTVEWLPVEPDGRLSLAALRSTMAEDVALVSVAMLNNETGVIQDIPAIARVVHEAGALLHVDAAQAGGRLAPDAGFAEADLLVLSAHKFYGPQGIGALCFNPRVRLAPLLHGGGQQQGLRSGTLPVALILGMAEAFSHPDDAAEQARQRALWQQLRERLGALGQVVLNSRDDGSAHILNVSFAGVQGAALQEALGDLAVSFGSACNSAQGPSHVLRAMRRPDALAHASVRLSLGRFTRAEDIAAVADQIEKAVTALRSVSPVWRELQAGAGIKDVYSVTTPLMLA